MIGLEDVKIAAIAKINSLISSGLLTPSTLDVAEFRYQGSDFTFPGIRVRVSMPSFGYKSGNCQSCVASLEFVAYSQNNAQAEASNLAEAIAANLRGKRLTLTGTTPSPIRIIQIVDPMPLPPGDRGWAVHVLAECDIPQV